MKFFLTILFSILFSLQFFAQEYTLPLNENTSIKTYIKEHPNKAKHANKNIASFELPFWDDFSENQIYPNTAYWSDNTVYINNTLALNPPSIGVATLDAVNANGEIYANADYNTVFSADTLTSLPLNLNYPGNTSIFLSFYYQAKGLGDAPETQDSLFLEFYAPDEDQWNEVWSVPGTDNTDFKFVIIPVDQEKFLKDTFQFRFRNYASFGTSIYPSLATNCDFWNIDYVYLNKDRTINDTVFHDIAFTTPLQSLLTDFSSVPWEHFKESGTQSLKNNINIAFKNNDNKTRLIDSLNFTLEDIDGTSENQYWYAGTYTPLAFQQSDISLSGQPFSFTENNNSESTFKLSARIVTDSYDSVQNNITSYTQSFKNWYAYDDGSAEAGYGLYGNGTKYGQVALKFSPLKQDYLTGVNMYFTHAYEDASQKYFWIYIWNSDNDGSPGDTIITFEGIRPEYEDELNKFHEYTFEKPVLIEGDFFIGWTQTTEDKLNIGFDYNTINNDKTFYNISGEWIQSQELGSLMIRPVFGTDQSNITGVETKKIKIYPNPARDYIHLDFARKPSEIYSIQIINFQGKEVYFENNFRTDIINVNQLPEGMYFIRLRDRYNQSFSSKFIKI